MMAEALVTAISCVNNRRHKAAIGAMLHAVFAEKDPALVRELYHLACEKIAGFNAVVTPTFETLPFPVPPTIQQPNCLMNRVCLDSPKALHPIRHFGTVLACQAVKSNALGEAERSC